MAQNQSSKKIVVTGASGHLGQSLLESLSLDNDVLAISRKRPTNLYNAKWQQFSTVSHHDFDCDLVIHAAATHPRAIPKPKPDEYIASNILLTEKIVELAKGRSKFFLFISTNYLKQGDATIYSASKLFGEALLKEYQEEFPAIVCLRIPGLLDPNPPACSFLVSALEQIISKNEKPFTNLDKYFDIIDGQMIADFCRCLIKSSFNGYNVCDLHSMPSLTLDKIIYTMRRLAQDNTKEIFVDVTNHDHLNSLTKQIGFYPPDTRIVLSRFVENFIALRQNKMGQIL